MTDLPLEFILQIIKIKKKGSVMVHILADILSLAQYQECFKAGSQQHRLDHCLHCGKANPHLHGHYPRQSYRSPFTQLNPILIQRYYCSVCKKTCSVLPECISPHRWYLWEIQQIALIMILSGHSINAIAKQIMPARRTIARWVARFQNQFRIHKNALCNHIADLGRATGFNDFWTLCLNTMSLAKAMRLCHVAGECVP